MANKKAAKKYLRKTKTRTVRNKAKKSNLKQVIKKVVHFIDDGKLEDAKKEMPTLQKALDKAAKTNLIHKNKANRIKKRLSKKTKSPKK